MFLKLAMQPYWVRALFSGVWFGLAVGLSDHFSSFSHGWRGVMVALVTAAVFGLGVAYTGQSMYTGLAEAVAGLDTAARAQVIAAVTDGEALADPTLKSSAIRFGRAYLRQKTDAQLTREMRLNWIVVPIFVLVMILGVLCSSSQYQAGYFLVCGLLCAILLSRGVMGNRRIQRNVAQLADGAIPA